MDDASAFLFIPNSDTHTVAGIADIQAFAISNTVRKLFLK